MATPIKLLWSALLAFGAPPITTRMHARQMFREFVKTAL